MFLKKIQVKLLIKDLLKSWKNGLKILEKKQIRLLSVNKVTIEKLEKWLKKIEKVKSNRNV